MENLQRGRSRLTTCLFAVEVDVYQSFRMDRLKGATFAPEGSHPRTQATRNPVQTV